MFNCRIAFRAFTRRRAVLRRYTVCQGYNNSSLLSRAPFRSITSIASSPRNFPTSGFKEVDLSEPVEEERLPNYKPENYYPVYIGEIFNSRYQVITKLGFGAASTIWLCRDLRDRRYLALKFHVLSQRTLPEIVLSEYINSINGKEHEGAKHVRRVLDWFEITGPHGKHVCLLYEPTGVDITTFIHRLENGALNENLTRDTARLILMGLDYLHKIHILHTDVQPNNILLAIDDDSTLVKLEDEELDRPVARKTLSDRIIYLTRYMPITSGEPILSDMGEARIAHEKQKGLIMPSIYRAPEVLLGMEWDSKVDIWGLAQTTWSIFEGDHLFRNISRTGELDITQRFAQMTAMMGPPPPEFLKRSEECYKYWDEQGNWTGSIPIPNESLESREGKLNGRDKERFLHFMKKVLRWLPEERPSAEQLLDEDEWLKGQTISKSVHKTRSA